MGQFEQAAERLRLKPLSDFETDEVESQVQRLVRGHRCRIWSAHFRTSGDARVVICESGLEPDPAQTDSPVREKQQTLCFIEFSGTRFPEFMAVPDSMLGRLTGRLLGGQDFDFEDSPEFSQAYVLGGQPESAVRKLFDTQCRELFAKYPGWTVRGRKGQLLLYQSDNRIEADRLEEFLRTALTLADALQTSVVEIPVDETIESLTREEALKRASKTTGLVGLLVRHDVQRTAIDLKDIHAFIDQPIPRDLPFQLKNRFGGDRFVYLFGGFASFVGSIFVLLSFFSGADWETRLGFGGIGGLIVAIGLGVIMVNRYFASRRLNVLRKGVGRDARVLELKESALVNGNERVFHATIEFVDDQSTIVSKLQGAAVREAEELVETGALTRVLQDPETTKVILIECYGLS